MPNSAISLTTPLLGPLMNNRPVIHQPILGQPRPAAAPAVPAAAAQLPNTYAKAVALFQEYCIFPNIPGNSGTCLATATVGSACLAGWSVCAIPVVVPLYLAGYSGEIIFAAGGSMCTAGLITSLAINPTIKVVANRLGCGDKI